MCVIISFRSQSVMQIDTKEEKYMEDITITRKKEIETVVRGILGNVGSIETPEVDIVSLVEKDNFEVETKDMDIDTTGLLFVNEDGERLIVVNTSFKNPDKEDDVVFKKSRFITAHEYGHFILHKDLCAHRDTYHRTEEKEIEADYFARSLLMPLHTFRVYYNFLKELSNEDSYVVETLCRIFKVTKNKVQKRVGDLSVLTDM